MVENEKKSKILEKLSNISFFEKNDFGVWKRVELSELEGVEGTRLRLNK